MIHILDKITIFLKMIFEVKMFGLLILFFHVSSSICETMDDEQCSSGSDIDQDIQCKQNKDAAATKYDGVLQSGNSLKESKYRETPKHENENKDQMKEELNSTVRREIRKRNKIDEAINNFCNDNFPTSYHTYNFSTPEEVKAKDQLDIIEQSVNEAVATRNQTGLQESYAKYTSLLAKYGPIARIYVQMADLMALMAQLIHSKPTFDSAMNLFNEVMILPELSDTLFTLVAKRRIAFLSLRADFQGMIDVQKKLVDRFPQNVEQLNKLAEIQYAYGHKLDAMDVLERVLKLDSSNQYAMATLGRMKASLALKNIKSTKTVKKLGNFEDKLKNMMASKGLKSNIDKDSDLDLSEDVEDGVEMMLRAIEDRDSAIMSSSTKAGLDGSFFYSCGETLRQLGRYDDADRIFEVAAKDGFFLSFWKRAAHYVKGLTMRPVWSIEQTGIAPLLNQVQGEWKNIREEAFGIIKRKLLQPQGEGISEGGKWGVYNLYLDGMRLEENCLNAPLTCSLIEKIPQISDTIRGRAKFSIMESGTHVRNHAGPTNARIRIHLGLKIPPTPTVTSTGEVTSAANSPCRARVVNEYFTWEDGKMQIFDDSFDHEVWQLDPLKRSRLLLIMDMAHPELTDAQLAAL